MAAPHLLLFDIDGTLTPPMGSISRDLADLLETLAEVPTIELGIVGGSDRAKAVKQVGEHLLTNVMDHAFHENGATYYRDTNLINQQRLEDWVSTAQLNEIIKYLLYELASIDCPVRTGTFIERRNCMLNVSPVGRACTQEQRDAFEAWDHEAGARKSLVERLHSRFADYPLAFACGGQISIDIYPKGLDKTCCLDQLDLSRYGSVHFFGDRCGPGGNDYEIYHDERVVGHWITGPDDTYRELLALSIDLMTKSLDDACA